MINDQLSHQPVLLKEVMACLEPINSGVYVDCTFGRGGYSRQLLDKMDCQGVLIALDIDPQAIAYGKSGFGDESRLHLMHANYDLIEDMVNKVLPGDPPKPVQGIVFDLGVSSPQLDNPDRGFSFRLDGPLDMRMDPSVGSSAAKWINTASQEEMAKVFFQFGEERAARPIARAIVYQRQQCAIVTTTQLAGIVERVVAKKHKRKIHPATKVFQAIRIYINNELEHLQRALQASLSLLALQGVLVVVSFHSLQDRLVKQLFRNCVQGPPLPDGLPLSGQSIDSPYEYVAKLIKTSKQEMLNNPRSRSARLRAIRRRA